MGDGPDRGARIEIYELHAKLNHLIDSGKGRADFCRKTGIHEHSLRRAIGNRGDRVVRGSVGALGIKDLERITKVFGFQAIDKKDEKGRILVPVWPPWLDVLGFARGDERQDTAANFVKEYRKLHSTPDVDLETVTVAGAEGREPLVDDGSALKVIADYADPSPMPGLASIIIYAGQTRLNKTLISATVFTDQYLVPETGKWLKVVMGVFSINCGKALADLRSVKSFKIDGSNGPVDWTVSGPSRTAPRWRIESISGKPLGDVGADPISLVNVEGLADGDEIEATFGTWFSLLSSAVVLEHGSKTANDKNVDASQVPFNSAQQKLAALLEKRCVDTDETNYAVIARYKIAFGRR